MIYNFWRGVTLSKHINQNAKCRFFSHLWLKNVARFVSSLSFPRYLCLIDKTCRLWSTCARHPSAGSTQGAIPPNQNINATRVVQEICIFWGWQILEDKSMDQIILGGWHLILHLSYKHSPICQKKRSPQKSPLFIGSSIKWDCVI